MHVVTLFISLFLAASFCGDAFQESQRVKDAKALWEKAIIAKGGREQLYSVNSLVLSYRETVQNFLGFDVVHTSLGDRRIDYFLDRKRHLPMRVAVFYGNGNKPTLTVEFSKYVSVGGIQMPGKQKRGSISFQINPLYDEGIFTRLPSLTTGPHAWQRGLKPTAQY